MAVKENKSELVQVIPDEGAGFPEVISACLSDSGNLEIYDDGGDDSYNAIVIPASDVQNFIAALGRLRPST
jgi:hypothetical protein